MSVFCGEFFRLLERFRLTDAGADIRIRRVGAEQEVRVGDIAQEHFDLLRLGKTGDIVLDVRHILHDIRAAVRTRMPR